MLLYIYSFLVVNAQTLLDPYFLTSALCSTVLFYLATNFVLSNLFFFFLFLRVYTDVHFNIIKNINLLL